MSMVDERQPGGDEPDVLAAEYVLGVLPAGERAAARARLETDLSFRRSVEDWENRLSDLNDQFEEAVPPAGAFARIEERLFGAADTTSSAGVLSRLWGSVALWRGLSVAAIALIAVTAALRPDLFTPRTPESPPLVVAMAQDGSPVRFVGLYDSASRSLRLNRIAGERDAQRDFELWVIEGGNDPVSLGVLPAEDTVTVALNERATALVHSDAVLAISSEPLGGSPTGQPTGPVVALGGLRAL